MKTRIPAVLPALLLAGPLALATPQQDQEHELQQIIVTGAFVTQGGAKDVNYLRGEVQHSRIPHPETFTAEGLLSEHSVLIGGSKPCDQLFCLTGEAMTADLLAKPEARYLVGLGFDTHVGDWQRPPLNLVAVVDKSGSMAGQPLALVRASLLEIVKHLRPGDQLSIVLYGDRAHVHLEPVTVSAANKGDLRASIAAIESEGSTAMELGLRLGYDVAARSAKPFEGITRVMLFTDERPNVGNTHAMGFMTMAREASRQGIGLTTIGVGQQFDAALATTIGSVRGGNLFFMRDEQDVKQVFRDEFDYMVSELAHDLQITISPQAGYSVAGVFGVPDQLMGWQNERTITVRLPTVFLSSKAGALFVALAKSRDDAHLPARPLQQETPLVSVALQYTPLNAGTAESDRLDVAVPAAQPSAALRLGHTLIDEFTVLHQALTAHHIENDQELAYQQIHALAARLHNQPGNELDSERELVNSLAERFAFLSGHASEHSQRRSPMAKLWGTWEVRGIQGRSDLKSRERLEFRANSDFLRYEKRDGRHVLADEDEFGATRRQIVIDGAGVVYDYEVRGNELVLADGRHQNLVFLQRVRD